MLMVIEKTEENRARIDVYRGVMAGILHRVFEELANIPGDTPLRKRWFLASRFLLRPRDHVEWTSFLRRQTGLRSGALPRDLLEKPLRSYIRHGLPHRRRLDLLHGHYRVAERRLPAWLGRALWAGQRVVLGELPGRAFAVRIVLARAIQARQEGELTLTVEDAADGLRLARIAFAFAGEPDAPDLVIGGLQGLPPGHDKQRIVQATRRMSGMRPKALALAATQALARSLGSSTLLAVSRANHTAAEKSRQHRNGFHADYDAFWRERGGVADPRFGFRLPVDPPPQATLRPADAARRQALVEALDRIFVTLIGRPARLIPFPQGDEDRRHGAAAAEDLRRLAS